MYKIAIDFAGQDLGPAVAVTALEQFRDANTNYEFVVVGNQAEIEKLFKNKTRISFINNTLVAKRGNFSLREAQRVNSSLKEVFRLLKDKQVHAIISSGDTALLLANATIMLERLPNISRPAFMPIFPTSKSNQRFVMLDVGANLEVKPEYLLQWAILASKFVKTILKIAEPRINLLNIGTESYKGFDWHHEAHNLLAAKLGHNYKGFLEPRDLMEHVSDVIVCDGYAGNMVLKSYEGAIKSFGKLVKSKILASTARKLAALLLKPAFKEIKETLDHRNVGGAIVLGIDGIVIKAHGNSDTKAWLGALNQLKIVLDTKVIEHLREDANGLD